MKYLLQAAAIGAALFAYTSCFAQHISHAKTSSVKVYGNCGMCEKTIEKAAFKKGVAKADWDQDTHIAVLTFDSLKTSEQEILQRIAAAGYDSDAYRADDKVYAGLHACCQYDRPEKSPAIQTPAPQAPGVGMVKKQAAPQVAETPAQGLEGVYSAYFSLKDALVASDAAQAARYAMQLSKVATALKSETLESPTQPVWLQHRQDLLTTAQSIGTSSDLEKQRQQFIPLSEHLFAVMKAAKPAGEVYLDYCPMANDGKGANWISRDKPIRNPYFGNAMLSCGKVKETLTQ